MTFDDLVGQEAAVALLRRALGAGRLPTALLFHGPEGVGKTTAARLTAAALNCEAEGSRPCGACTACRKVARGLHPDVLFVTPQPQKVKENASLADPDTTERDPKEEPSRFIRVFQIREMIEHAAFDPHEGRARVFILEPADQMNAEAQNALLKTLEEPPAHTVLILITARPFVLLSTVRSRCVLVGFRPVPVADLVAWLKRRGVPEDEALARASLSGGRPGRARALDVEPLRERRQRLLDLVQRLTASPAALKDLPVWVETLTGRTDASLKEGLDLLEALLRDALRLAEGGPEERTDYQDLAAELRTLGRRAGAARLAAWLTSVERLRHDLRLNINPKLLAESLGAALAGGPVP